MGRRPPLPDGPLKINLITRDNGAGLSTDVELLSEFLSGLGHDVEFADWQRPRMRTCDIGIFLELFNPTLVRFAARTVGVFNLEWFLGRWTRHLLRFDHLWAKSIDAHEAFLKIGMPRSYLTGFLSRDLLDESVEREMSCFHLKGHSDYKNTNAVIEAWRRNPDLPPLTIVSNNPVDAPEWVRTESRLPQAELVRLMNRSMIHVCPSAAEGWGHYITEGLSVGALVVATDKPPMNEHVANDWGILVRPSASRDRGMVKEHDVDPDDVAMAVRTLSELEGDRIEAMSRAAREHMLSRNEAFRNKVTQLLEDLRCT